MWNDDAGLISALLLLFNYSRNTIQFFFNIFHPVASFANVFQPGSHLLHEIPPHTHVTGLVRTLIFLRSRHSYKSDLA